MTIRESVKRAADLHERARRGELSDADLSAYREELAELTQALLAAQTSTLEPGQKARATLRVARAVQVELNAGEYAARTTTLNLSAGGFAALLLQPPPLGDVVHASLGLPGNRRLHAQARAVSVRPQNGYARVGFQFMEMSPADAQELGALVLDTVLGHLAHG